jgi:hypothetical protein
MSEAMDKLEIRAASDNDRDQDGMSVKVITDIGTLKEHVRDWEELAAAAIEPNPFYEPWMLMPAIESFGAGKDLRFALVFSGDSERPVLCGLFPLERKRSYKGLPVATLKLWQHLYCFSCVPLVRADRARECLATFLNWIESAEISSLMEFTGIAGEGSFYELLIEGIRARQRTTYIDGRYERGLLRRAADAEQYLQSTVSATRRKKLRRQQRQLSETGTLEYPALAPDGNIDRWIEEFLQLEASGWKGKEKSAMNCQDADRRFFEAIARSAFEKGRLSMLAIHLDGQVIASQCNFLAGSGAFAFKVAFDERYARFSPGVLLEIEHIRRLHGSSSVDWMDSCCGRPDTYFDALCNGRKIMLTVVVATKRMPGGIVISVLPVLRWINRLILNRVSR